jgi:hypothetical protein
MEIGRCPEVQETYKKTVKEFKNMTSGQHFIEAGKEGISILVTKNSIAVSDRSIKNKPVVYILHYRGLDSRENDFKRPFSIEASVMGIRSSWPSGSPIHQEKLTRVLNLIEKKYQAIQDLKKDPNMTTMDEVVLVDLRKKIFPLPKILQEAKQCETLEKELKLKEQIKIKKPTVWL